MKKDIHPKYFPEAKVTCACGNTFVTGSTKSEIRTDVCSACHPFFTGEQRIVDTAGQVDRFIRRLERRGEIDEKRSDESTSARKARPKRPQAVALVDGDAEAEEGAEAEG